MTAPLPAFDSVAVVLLRQPEGRIVAANRAFLKLTELTRKRAVGASLRQLGLIADGYEKAELGKPVELTWRLPSGSIRQTLSRVESADAEGTHVMLLNVELTALMPETAVAGVRNADRAYLGRVFHDGLTQEIGAAAFLVEVLRRQEIPPELGPHLEKLAAAVRRCSVAGAAFAQILKAG
jgi:PAS domain-containing protein